MTRQNPDPQLEWAINTPTVLEPASAGHLLDVSDARIYYHSTRGIYKVVDGVSFTMRPNEIFGLAGESGCGKSTLVEGILRLIEPPGRIEDGQALFHLRTEGTQTEFIDLFHIDEERLRKIRWRNISYIPQGSMNSLNPVIRIEEQLADAIVSHDPMRLSQAKVRAAELLATVGLAPEVAHMYPHELSGGMKQRAIIATAMGLQPQLVVADEPTTALDVNIQRVILQAIADLKENYGMSVLLVSHDMAVHAELVDRLAIMYAGKVVEIADVRSAFHSPLHPYSQALISSIPSLEQERKRIDGLHGLSPSPLDWPVGCRFHPRCPHAMDICKAKSPLLQEIEPDRLVACHLYTDGTHVETIQNP
jgi:peptide/nickel transport system ATP-binding protein